jgi:hypothetical protein
MHCRAWGLSVLAVAALLVTRLGGVAARDGGFAELAGVPEIQVTLTDGGVEGVPAETPAGWALFTFTNNVTPTDDPFADAWSLEIVQLPEGVAAAELAALFAAGPEGSPPAAGDEAVAEPASPETEGADPFAILYESYVAGGPGALQGESGTALVNLQPGTYAVLVFGIGAAADLTVSGEAAGETPAVTSDVVITETGTSGSFDFSVEAGAFAGGPAVLEVVNESDQPHFVIGVRSPGPITEEMVMALLMSEESGTPRAGAPDPGQLVPSFLTGTQSPGTMQYAAVDLEPGYYILLCFIGDPAMGGVPHSFAGMIEIVPIGV